MPVYFYLIKLVLIRGEKLSLYFNQKPSEGNKSADKELNNCDTRPIIEL